MLKKHIIVNIIMCLFWSVEKNKKKSELNFKVRKRFDRNQEKKYFGRPNSINSDHASAPEHDARPWLEVYKLFALNWLDNSLPTGFLSFQEIKFEWDQQRKWL